MDEIITKTDLILVQPYPERDAPFAHEWLSGAEGFETLLAMGNAPHEISESTLESERETIRDFLRLESEGKQLTWAMRVDYKTIGAVWIALEATEYLASPAVHIMIGDKSYRGGGHGYAAIMAVIDYAKNHIASSEIYSRHMIKNKTAAKLLSKCGFEPVGKAYRDKNDLLWQNVVRSLK